MQISEKLRVLRQSKNLTQEELAEQLGWGIKTYANIERGKTKITVDKLEKIAQMLGITLDELVEDINEKTILNYAENCNPTNLSQSQNSIFLTETQCAHELEKAQLLLQERDKEIENLKQQISQLQDIVTLLKKESM